MKNRSLKKFVPFRLLTVIGVAGLVDIVLRSRGSIMVAVFMVVDYLIAPFRLVMSLVAGLGSGLTLRGWAAVEIMAWWSRRKLWLATLRSNFRHRHVFEVQPVTLIEFSDSRPGMIVPGGHTQGDGFLGSHTLGALRVEEQLQQAVAAHIARNGISLQQILDADRAAMRRVAAVLNARQLTDPEPYRG